MDERTHNCAFSTQKMAKKQLSYKSDVTCDQHSTFSASCSTIDQHTFEETINTQRFSNWDRLLRSLPYCYLLVDIIRKPNVDKTLEFRHLTEAFSYVITSQRQQIGDDITTLQKSIELSTETDCVLYSPSSFSALVDGYQKTVFTDKQKPYSFGCRRLDNYSTNKTHSYRKRTQWTGVFKSGTSRTLLDSSIKKDY